MGRLGKGHRIVLFKTPTCSRNDGKMPPGKEAVQEGSQKESHLFLECSSRCTVPRVYVWCKYIGGEPVVNL
jgi:hypothetical protein